MVKFRINLLILAIMSLSMLYISGCGSSNDVKNIKKHEEQRVAKLISSCNDSNTRCMSLHTGNYCSTLYKQCINTINKGLQ